MLASMLSLLVLFLLTWFSVMPQPFKMVCFVIEAVILALYIIPISGGLRPIL
jgi:predicted membrane chloride channel (bestrophin family)